MDIVTNFMKHRQKKWLEDKAVDSGPDIREGNWHTSTNG